jgi:hypothetical protein
MCVSQKASTEPTGFLSPRAAAEIQGFRIAFIMVLLFASLLNLDLNEPFPREW